MMKYLNYLIFAALALTLVACGEDENEDSGWQIGDSCFEGQSLQFSGANLCVYDTTRNPIIETGFSCPADLPFQYEFGEDVIVCARQPTLPPNLQDELARLLPEFEIESPWVVGAGPEHDPMYTFDAPAFYLRGRSAGTCSVTSDTWGDIEYEYDQEGRLIRAGESRYEYDEFGWLAGVSNGSDTFTSIERDELGRVTRIFSSGETVYEYQRDEKGRRVVRTKLVGGEIESEHQFQWSDDGLSVEGLYAGMSCEGTTTFDRSGKVVRRDQPDCSAFGDPLNEYAYNDDGNLTEIRFLDRETDEVSLVFVKIEYDSSGRPIRSVRTAGPEDRTGTELLVSYEGDAISSMALQRLVSGQNEGNWQLEGECLLSGWTLSLRYTHFGSILPPE